MTSRAGTLTAAFIYKITAPETDEVYIGSCTTSLKIRQSDHQRTYNKWAGGEGKYVSSFAVVACPDWEIKKIEDYPCATLEELRIREGYWILNTPGCCNRNIAGRTRKEYRSLPEIKQKDSVRLKTAYQTNKVAIAAAKKRYYQANKAQKQLQARNYYKAHTEYYKNYQQKLRDARIINSVAESETNEFIKGSTERAPRDEEG